MAQARLKVFHGPESTTSPARADDRSVRVTLGEVLPLLIDAVLSERTWLQDFQDEEATISADLYETILAYRRLRRRGA